MKILHIIRTVDQEGGGPIEGIYQLAAPMQLLEHTVEILSLDHIDDKHIKQTKLKVHALGQAGSSKYGYSAKFKLWLVEHHHEYDVFVINGIWQYHSYATHSVLKQYNRAYYVFTHGMLDPWFKKRYPLKHLKKCLYWLWGEYPVLRDAKKVLFTCEDEKNLAVQSFWPHQWSSQVVNYGTAGQIGDQTLQRQLFLNTFPQLQGKRFLLFLSRIHQKKGVDILIRAYQRSNLASADVQLVIAGPDQVGWQVELEKLASELGVANNITWTGMLRDDLKWGAYLCSDVFVLPSHQENFGIVVAEALSCGKPVLISDQVNIWHEIQADDAGFVDKNNLRGTINNLKRFIDLDPPKYAQMAENALSCFNSRFHIKKASERLLRLFLEKNL